MSQIISDRRLADARVLMLPERSAICGSAVRFCTDVCEVEFQPYACKSIRKHFVMLLPWVIFYDQKKKKKSRISVLWNWARILGS